MALPFLSPARTVLLIGDEALYVYKTAMNAVRLLGVVPWKAEDFNVTVVRLIRKEGGGKPVLLVNDMTDQHYKGGQRIPRVSPLDRKNVLERKLQMTFSNYPIRGALPLKKVKGGASGGKDNPATSGGMYLFAAIPMSEAISKTLTASKAAFVSVSGLVLLPIEASDMVSALSAKLKAKGAKKSKWTIFIGQHQSGALRQVIIRDGQLAMTRMTPVSNIENVGARTWASEVAQEFKATISYLSRFGYNPEEETDVITVAQSEAGLALKELITIPCNYSSFTVNEAARLLGVGIGRQADQGYADPLHAAWIARKNRFILPMQARDIEGVLRPRQYAAAATVLLFLGAGYLSWDLINQAQGMLESRETAQLNAHQLQRVQADLQIETERMDALGVNVRLLQAGVASYTNLQEGSLGPMPILHRIGEALGPEIRLDSLLIKVDEVDEQEGEMQFDPYTGEAVFDNIARFFSAELYLSFPASFNPQVAVREISDLEARLRRAMPEYEVSVQRQVTNMNYTENVRGEIGAARRPQAEAEAERDYVAEIRIRGVISQ